jgi:hypothetical protein
VGKASKRNPEVRVELQVVTQSSVYVAQFVWLKVDIVDFQRVPQLDGTTARSD